MSHHARKEDDEERRSGAVLPWPTARVASAPRFGWLSRVLGVEVSATSPLGVLIDGTLTLLSSPLGLAAVLVAFVGLNMVLREGRAVEASDAAPAFPAPDPRDATVRDAVAPGGGSIDQFRSANAAAMPEAGPSDKTKGALAEALAAVKDGGDEKKKPGEGASEKSPGAGESVGGKAGAPGGAGAGEGPVPAPTYQRAAASWLLARSGAMGTPGSGSGAFASGLAPRGAPRGPSDPFLRPGARVLTPARLRRGGGPGSPHAFGQLRFADNRSRLGAAQTGEASRYSAAEAFDGNRGQGGGGGITGAGLGAGTGGTGAESTPSASPGEPIRSVPPSQEGAPGAGKGGNKTPYQQQVILAVALLALSAVLILAAAVCSLLAKNPAYALYAAKLLGMAQALGVAAAGVAAGASAIGIWVAAAAGQTMQGSLLTGAGAMLAVMGVKVAMDAAAAAKALTPGADPMSAAEAGAAQTTAAEMPSLGHTALGVKP